MQYPFSESLTTSMVSPRAGLAELLCVIQKASEDPRVDGIAANISCRTPLSYAQAQELRNAIFKFRSTNRFAICYSDSFESSWSRNNLYLASAFDKIYINPGTSIQLSPLRMEREFYKNLLDKWGVHFENFSQGKYKSYWSMISQTHFTNEQREELNEFATSIFDQIVNGIAEGRNIPVQIVKKCFEHGTMTADDAINYGLVDKLAFTDEMKTDIDRVMKQVLIERIKQAAPLKDEIYRYQQMLYESIMKSNAQQQITEAMLQERRELRKIKSQLIEQFLFLTQTTYNFVRMHDYYHKLRSSNSWLMHMDKPVQPDMAMKKDAAGNQIRIVNAQNIQPQNIAFLRIHGPIDRSVLFYIRALRRISNDPSFPVVLLRIDSPGGSATASDLLQNEVELLKKKGKKVVVSMGNICASGGYMVASGADHLLANPGTITGSIGVANGKFSLGKAAERLGITYDAVTVGGDSSGDSIMEKTSQGEINKKILIGKTCYERFVSIVAKGRKKTYQEIDEIAQGRIYTGEQALNIGLVDSLGGISEAMEIAKTFVTGDPTNVRFIPISLRHRFRFLSSGNQDPMFDEGFEEDLLLHQNDRREFVGLDVSESMLLVNPAVFGLIAPPCCFDDEPSSVLSPLLWGAPVWKRFVRNMKNKLLLEDDKMEFGMQ